MRFIDAPPPASQLTYIRISEVLKDHPGQWAELFEGSSNLVGAYASRYRGRGGRLFEFTQRSAGRGTGRSILYGRYVGDPDAGDTRAGA